MSIVVLIAIIVLLFFGYKTMNPQKKEKYCAACLMR